MPNFPRTETLNVRATDPEKPVPMARARRHLDRRTGRDTNAIYHDKPVRVPNNRYYRRRVTTGELELVEGALAAAPTLAPNMSTVGTAPEPMRLTTRVQPAEPAEPTDVEEPPASDPSRSEE